jgi:hypothetical protein
MAIWVRTEDENAIRFIRADAQAGYVIWKHGHWHAEQYYPWTEDASGRRSAADIDNWFRSVLAAVGDVLTNGGGR